MATANPTVVTTLSPTASLQSENRQGGRKRKQDMPSAAAYSNQEPNQRMTPVNTDKSLLASIKAVISFNIPEEIVRSCATNMKNNGKVVNASSLLEECELHYQVETQLQSYAERVDTTTDDALSGAEFSGTSSATAYALPPQLSSHHSSESSSAPSEYTSFSSSSRNNHSNSRQANGHENRGSRENSYESTISHLSSDPHHYIAAQSGDLPDAGEDCVDGLDMSSLGGVSGDSFEGELMSSAITESSTSSVSRVGMNKSSSTSLPLDVNSSLHSASHNGLGRPGHLSYLPSLPTSQPVVPENVTSYWATQGSGSSRRHQPGASHFDQSNSANELSFVRNSSTTFENSIQIRDRTQPERDIVPQVRSSVQDKAEYLKICFMLVEKEHALLEKSRLCSLCSIRPRDVTFLPCGHFAVCRTCAEPIFVCPSCKNNILATVDTYLS